VRVHVGEASRREVTLKEYRYERSIEQRQTIRAVHSHQHNCTGNWYNKTLNKI
jgi:hypothetical protein